MLPQKLYEQNTQHESSYLKSRISDTKRRRWGRPQNQTFLQKSKPLIRHRKLWNMKQKINLPEMRQKMTNRCIQH